MIRPSRPLAKTQPKRKRIRDDGPFRAAVMAAFGEQCRVPGCRRSWIQAAHIWSKGTGGPSVVENGLPLCQQHHTDYDGYRVKLNRDWLTPRHLAWLAERVETIGFGAPVGPRYVDWDDQGDPYGRGMGRFQPLTFVQLARMNREDQHD